jgi:hypothetical protein
MKNFNTYRNITPQTGICQAAYIWPSDEGVLNFKGIDL